MQSLQRPQIIQYQIIKPGQRCRQLCQHEANHSAIALEQRWESFLTHRSQWALKFDWGSGAGGDGWRVSVTHPQGEKKYIMGNVECTCFNVI